MLAQESIRGAQELFNAIVEAEERKELFIGLLERGVGVPSVEWYHRKQLDACRVQTNKKRKSPFIASDMRFKLKDIKDHLRELIRSKKKRLARIFRNFGPEEGKLVKSELERKSEEYRKKVKQKYKQKTSHLSEKFHSSHKLPEKLKRYESAAIFGEDGVAEKESFLNQQEALVYGDISLDEDEIAALRLDPKFAVFDKLSEENFVTEMEMTFAKMRWNQYDKVDDEENDNIADLPEEEEEKLELLDAKVRMAYDPETKTFDLRNLKATDVKLNTKVFLPQPQSVQYETQLEIRNNQFSKVFTNYVQEKCDDKMRQKPNLSVNVRKGIAKLKKRISEGELIVLLTDKSGRLACMPFDMYHEAAEEHLKKDVEVGEDFAEQTQRLLNGHVSMWLKITGMGERWDHEQRQRETHLEESASVAPLYLLVKDHKKYSGSGPPPTRPVCGAVSGMNVHLSNILSPYLDAIADEMDGTMEIISTEDGLNRIDCYNAEIKDEQNDDGGEKIPFLPPGDDYETDEEEFLDEDELFESQMDQERQDEDDIVITGSDIKQLFPAMKTLETSELVYKAAMETKIKFNGINYTELSVFLALTLSNEEAVKNNIYHLLPKRKHRRGRKPKITGTNAMAAEPNYREQWIFPQRHFTPLEQRKMFALALKITVQVLFQNHLYQFGGKYYRQSDGAPIGVSSSMSASRVVTGMFDRELRQKMSKNKLRAKKAIRYVDDIRLIMAAIRYGWRLDGDKLVYRKCWEEEERREGISPEKKTADVMQQLMDGVFPYLKFEMETPEMFNGPLPTLDFQCWVTDKNRVEYTYFQKPMAKETLIMRDSALSEKVVISSLTQNLVRRMLNTSETVNIEERIKVVNQFSYQLRLSGYSAEQSRDIVKAGLTGYENLLERSKKEKKNLHRSAEEGQEERRKKKVLAKGNWFKKKGKRVGEKESFLTKKKRKEKIKRDEPETVTVMFVPQTPGGELRKRLQREEDKIAKMTKERIKIVERSGTTIKQILHKSNPWASGHCNRVDCLMCANGDGKQNCREKNIVYQISCMECAAERAAAAADSDLPRCRLAIYTGQTSRTGYERGREHFIGLQKKNENNPLFKHAAESHNKDVQFKMKVVKRHFSAMSRLVHESVVIERNSKDSSIAVLNSRLEYSKYVIPRLTLEDEDVDKNKDRLQEKESFLVDDGQVGHVQNIVVGSDGDIGQVESQSETKLNFTSKQNSDEAVGEESGGAISRIRSRRMYRNISANFKVRKKQQT